MSKAMLLKIHRYCGLAAALTLFVQAITGMALVYRDDLAQWIDPAGMVRHAAGADLPAARILAAAEAAVPGFATQRLAYPKEARGTYLAHMAGPDGTMRYASIDPASAEVLRAGSIWHFPLEAAFNIHYRLMAGTAGMALVALAGMLLLCLSVTGLLFWWPKRGRMGKNLTIQWQLKFRLVLRQLHRSTGVAAAIILGFSAATGLLLALPMIAEALSGPLRAPVQTGQMAAVIGKAVALARHEFPGHSIRDIRMAGPGQLNVFFNAPQRNSRAVHRASLDLAAPRIVAIRPARDDRALWVTLLPLHTGETFGPAGRVLILFGGFMLMLLAVSGPVMWFQARRMKRRPPARPTLAPRITA